MPNTICCRPRPVVLNLLCLALVTGTQGLACAASSLAARSDQPAGGPPHALHAQERGRPPQIPRDQWKDCAFNDQVIGCIDQQLPTGLRILWKDGIQMTYTEKPPTLPGGVIYLRDTLGGLWRREILQQGNTILTNLTTGNRIFIPLRYPCKPPLKGEVGYCEEE
jgi:hypothetical protein